jgi:hypothetical protein
MLGWFNISTNGSPIRKHNGNVEWEPKNEWVWIMEAFKKEMDHNGATKQKNECREL